MTRQSWKIGCVYKTPFRKFSHKLYKYKTVYFLHSIANVVYYALQILQSSQIPTTITEGSSSYDSSDAERTDLVGNDESDEVSGDIPCY